MNQLAPIPWLIESFKRFKIIKQPRVVNEELNLTKIMGSVEAKKTPCSMCPIPNPRAYHLLKYIWEVQPRAHVRIFKKVKYSLQYQQL
jgi:hypothetical protein